jgi:hypothetical protein
MTATFDAAAMKKDFSGIVDDLGVRCVVTRFSGAVNSAGHMSGTFITVGSDLMYITPARIREINARDAAGIMEMHTHECYQRSSGMVMKAEDRIAASGDVYVYDVLHAEIYDNHRRALVRQVKKS